MSALAVNSGTAEGSRCGGNPRFSGYLLPGSPDIGFPVLAQTAPGSLVQPAFLAKRNGEVLAGAPLGSDGPRANSKGSLRSLPMSPYPAMGLQRDDKSDCLVAIADPDAACKVSYFEIAERQLSEVLWAEVALAIKNDPALDEAGPR
jgi:hypothetical protein